MLPFALTTLFSWLFSLCCFTWLIGGFSTRRVGHKELAADGHFFSFVAHLPPGDFRARGRESSRFDLPEGPSLEQSTLMIRSLSKSVDPRGAHESRETVYCFSDNLTSPCLLCTHLQIRPARDWYRESGADVAEGRKIYFTLDISNDLGGSGRRRTDGREASDE